MSDDTHTAFFYGTLMAPSVLKRVIHGPTLPNSTTTTLPTTIRFTPAILPNHRRHRVKEADYPAVVPAPPSSTSSSSTPSPTSASVRGTLVSGLTEGDIWRLDIFEGEEYARKPVTAYPILSSSSSSSSSTAAKDPSHIPSREELGEGVNCETYIWIADREDLDEEEWDFDEFVRERMWRWSGEGASGEGLGDVDEAVRSSGVEGGVGSDPTGGRRFGDGSISRELENSRGKVKEEKEKEEDVLRSAV